MSSNSSKLTVGNINISSGLILPVYDTNPGDGTNSEIAYVDGQLKFYLDGKWTYILDKKNDGSTADKAAISASQLRTVLGAAAVDGNYWYKPTGQTTAIQLYTNFTNAPSGKGYVLVARGRESTDWWNTNGQNTSALT